ncbi:sterol carrier protein 2-like, partial [Convolutriloba macropyga]|uniref:sterol carrier protein 2-like n=1 Tax=Convolutriloba macropyga TaxID=536237 RepID=UPI003F527DFC
MKVYVVGIGMTNFEKPGRRGDFDYPVMALEATRSALADAKLVYSDVERAFVGYCYGESCCGQKSLYQLGMTGIPIVNVNNNCATGSSALYLAHEMVAGSRSDCVLALGFEKMERGSLGSKWDDRANPAEDLIASMVEKYGFESGPPTAQLFGNAGREHMSKYGTKPSHFAKIAHKNHLHSTKNPRSQFRDEYSLEQIESSKCIHDPLTKLQCCPTSDGAAAAVVVSERFLRMRPDLREAAVEIMSIALTTDLPSTFNGSAMNLVGYE